MLSLDDPRWATLTAGHRLPFDLRPLLLRLEAGGETSGAWDDLWQQLHHQGDVGEGSFAAVPHLVRIHRQLGVVDWNTYAMVATIELARGTRANPDVPAWAQESYDRALVDLGRLGLEELPRAHDPETVRSILGLLAVVHGARPWGRVLIEFTESEIQALERAAFGGGPAASGPAGA